MNLRNKLENVEQELDKYKKYMNEGNLNKAEMAQNKLFNAIETYESDKKS